MSGAGSRIGQSSVYAQVNTERVMPHLGARPSCQHPCSSMTPSPDPQSLQHAAQGLLIMHALMTSVELEGACCSPSTSSEAHHACMHDKGF